MTTQISDLLDRDFHTLTSAEVERLLAEADRVKYRKPGERERQPCTILPRETTTRSKEERQVSEGSATAM